MAHSHNIYDSAKPHAESCKINILKTTKMSSENSICAYSNNSEQKMEIELDDVYDGPLKIYIIMILYRTI